MLEAALRNASRNQSARHHLMIAGTGRAGTTFLVRYLTELGFETYLSRHGGGDIDDAANAGLEHTPGADAAGELPYVVKSPWLYEYVDEMLQTAHLDGVIIPVRDLGEAAASRVLVEMDQMHHAAPWLAQHQSAFETWGWSPGGAVFSLNPVDQARLLAVGFHRLIARLVEAEVPLIFVSFPRMVLEADYLFRALAVIMPPGTTELLALAAHGRVAEAAKIRVENEISESEPASPDQRTLEAIAIRRQLNRVRAELDAVRASPLWKVSDRLRRLRGALHRRVSRAGA